MGGEVGQNFDFMFRIQMTGLQAGGVHLRTPFFCFVQSFSARKADLGGTFN
jgi:hypothetical protein